jgi:hypothetical protein
MLADALAVNAYNYKYGIYIFRAVAVNNSLMAGTGSVCGAPWEVMRGEGGGDREFLTPCSTQHMQAFLLPDQLAITRPSGQCQIK